MTTLVLALVPVAIAVVAVVVGALLEPRRARRNQVPRRSGRR
jgi:hypothetical protein